MKYQKIKSQPAISYSLQKIDRPISNMVKLAIIFCFLGFTMGTGLAQNDDLSEAIDRYLAQSQAEGFNGMVWVEKDGEVILKKAYGLADREENQPLTLDHGFSMGSIQKWFTRMSVELLDRQGKLSLKDKLPKYFNNVPEDKQNITLEHIIKHKSGLLNYLGGDYEVIDKEEATRRALEADLVSKPGGKFNYSNAGYSLLAMVVEEVAEMPYEEFVYQHFLKPAGMERTGYRKGGWTKETLAKGYYADGKPWGTSMHHAWAIDGPSWTLRGNGGMLTTMEDLRKMLTLLENQPGAPKVIGTAGGNGIFNVDIEWDFNKHSGIIIMSTDERLLAEDLILQRSEGKKLLNRILN